MEDRPYRTICLDELRRRIARLEGTRGRGGKSPVTSGSTVLDAILPAGGFRCGTLIEWLSVGEGAGACTLAVLAAREACRNGGVLVALDRRGEFCPPAAVRLGIEPEQLLVVHAQSAADHDWAMDQVLRSPVVAAVLAWPERLDGLTFRRWQLAAEEGGGLGLLLRPETARSEPSWADVRLLVEPQCALVGGDSSRWAESRATEPFPSATGVASYSSNPSKRLLRIVVLRCRGGIDGRGVDVELDDETYLVRPAVGRRLQIAN